MARRRILGLIAAIALVPTLVGVSAATSLARLTDSDTSTGAFATDTLDPPTTLAATGGASTSLTWIATPDPYAAGYELRRATVTGGPYTLVSTITPRSTVATTDTPAIATARTTTSSGASSRAGRASTATRRRRA